MTEVPGERCTVRDIRFPTAVRPARTPWPIESQRHMTELTRNVVAPPQKFAVNDHSDADAVRNTDEHDVACCRSCIAAHCPHLSESARASGVFDLHRQANGR